MCVCVFVCVYVCVGWRAAKLERHLCEASHPHSRTISRTHYIVGSPTRLLKWCRSRLWHRQTRSGKSGLPCPAAERIVSAAVAAASHHVVSTCIALLISCPGSRAAFLDPMLNSVLSTPAQGTRDHLMAVLPRTKVRGCACGCVDVWMCGCVDVWA